MVGHEWLADQFKARDPEMEAYALLKCRLCYSAHEDTLYLHFNKSRRYSPIRALDPALHARLKSALQRPELNPSTRAKIEAALGRKNDTQ